MNARVIRGTFLTKRTNKNEKPAAEFPEFKKLFNVVKFRRAYILVSNNKRKICSSLLRKTARLTRH